MNATQSTVELLDCGHPESPHSETTRGYGRDAAGKTKCYDCCEADDLARIDAGEPFVGYLTDRRVTNWPGRTLLSVTSVAEQPRVGFGGRTYVRAIDRNGKHWYGSGPLETGTYVRMRRVK